MASKLAYEDALRELEILDKLDENTNISTGILENVPPEETNSYSQSVLEAQKAFSKNNVQAKKNDTAESLALAKKQFKQKKQLDYFATNPNMFGPEFKEFFELSSRVLNNPNIPDTKRSEIIKKLSDYNESQKKANNQSLLTQDFSQNSANQQRIRANRDALIREFQEIEAVAAELEVTAQAPFTTSPAPIEDEITPQLPGSQTQKPPEKYSDRILGVLKDKGETLATRIEPNPNKPKIIPSPSGLDLSSVTPNEKVVNTLEEIGAANRRLTANSPIVERFGAVARHADNTWSVTTVDGKFIPGMNEVTARAYQVYNERYTEAVKAGAPTDTLTNKLFEYYQGWVNHVGLTGLHAMHGSTTLVERIEEHNSSLAERSIRFGMDYDRNTSISPDDVKRYQSIKTTSKLSPEDIAFKESPKFKTISKLEGKAFTSKEWYERVEDFGKYVKKFIPVDDKEFRSAHMAFKTLQKTKGNIAALGNAISEDLGTYMGQFAGSIPYMTILTAGGAIAQSGVFYALVKGQSEAAIQEWVKLNGEENLTPEIITRIEAWKTVGLLFEKLSAGYVVKLLNKSLPHKAQLAWVTKVRDAVKSQTPESVLTLGKVAGRITSAIGVEAISGGGTEFSDQMGLHGKIVDPNEIVHGAFAEAAAIPLAGPGMIAQSQIAKAAMRAVKNPAIDNRIKAEQQIHDLETRLNSNTPLTFGDSAESEERRNDFIEVEKRLADLENGRDSQTFKKVYEDLIKGGTPREDALKLADEILEDAWTSLVKDKETLTKILNMPLPATEETDIRNRFKNTIEILKQAIKEGDLSNKKIKEVEEQTTAAVRGDLVPIEDKAFDLALADIDISETADVEKTWKQIEKLGNRKLTDKQNEALYKISQEFESIVDPEGKDKTEPTSFSSLERLGNKKITTDETLAEEIANPDIKTEDKKILEAEQDSRESDKERKRLAAELAAEAKETKDKSLAQVSKEILQGKSKQWRGFDTYRSEIEEVARDLSVDELLRRVEIDRIEGDMNTLLANLQEKLEVFKTTRELFKANPPQAYKTKSGKEMPAKVWVVYGHQDASSGRIMGYTVPTKPVSISTYNREKKKGRIAFVINEKSNKLIRTLEAEVKYGEDTIKVVTGHKNTSYSRIAEQEKSESKKKGEIVGYLRRFMTSKLNRKTLLTEEEIEQAEIDKKAEPPPVTKTAYSDKKRWPTVAKLKAQLKEFQKVFKTLNENIQEEHKSTKPIEGKLSTLVSQLDQVEDHIREIEAELKLRDEKDEPTTIDDRTDKQKSDGVLTEKIFTSFKDTADAVQWLIDNSTNTFYVAVAKIIQKLVGNHKLTYENKNNDKYNAVVRINQKTKGVKEIVFTPKGLKEEALLHELIHVALNENWYKPKTAAHKAARKELEDIAFEFQRVYERMLSDTSDKYAVSDLAFVKKRIKSIEDAQELVTYILTNPRMQEIFKKLPARNKKEASLWSEFTKAIRKLLGLTRVSYTLFEEILEATGVLLDETAPPTPTPKPKPPSTSKKVTIISKGKFTRLDTNGEDISVTGTVIKLGDRGVLGVTEALGDEGFDVVYIKTKEKVPYLDNIADEASAIEAAKLLAPKIEAQEAKPKPEKKTKSPKEKLTTWTAIAKELSEKDLDTLNKYLSSPIADYTEDDIVEFINNPSSKKLDAAIKRTEVEGAEGGASEGAEAYENNAVLKITQKLRKKLNIEKDQENLAVDFEGQESLSEESLEDFLKNLRNKVDTDPHFIKTDKELGDFIINLLKTKPPGYEEEIENAKAELTQRAKDRKSKGKGEVSDKAPPVSDETSGDAGEDTDTGRTQEQKKNRILTEGIINSFKDTAEAVNWIINNTLDGTFKLIAQEIQDKIKPGIPITYVAVFPDKKTGDFTRKGKDIAGSSSPTGIQISELGLTENTLLHELIHQAIGPAYKKPKTKAQKRAVSKLQRIASTLRQSADNDTIVDALVTVFKETYPEFGTDEKQLRSRIKSYLKTIGEAQGEELVTHALTSPYAQLILKNGAGIKETAAKRANSLWDNFTQAIRTLLNIPDSVSDTLLDQVLDASAVFIVDKGKANKRVLNKESYSKQAFRSLFPEIITSEGELVSDEELYKHSAVLDRLAAQLNITATEKQKAADDKSGIITKVKSRLEKLPQSINFIEGSSVKFPATVTNKELKDQVNNRPEVEKLKDKARTARIKVLLAKNQENILGLLGKRFSELVGMRPGSRGVHTIPDVAFLSNKTLRQALIDLMATPVVAEGHQLLLPLPPDKTKQAEIEKAAGVLVNQFRTYEKRYDNIAYDLDSHTNTDPDWKNKANFSLRHPLTLLYKDGKLPPQLIFMMMLGITTWRQYHKNNNPFLHKNDRERFLYGSQQELTNDENAELDNIKFNYREATNDVGLMIISMAKMFAKKDIKYADLYFSKLIPSLGMAALQIEHGRFDKKTIDGKSYLDSDYGSAAYDESSKIQIETREWGFKEYVENRNYNNKISTEEANELSDAIDEYGNKLYRNKVESNTGLYKHIRVNPDVKITKNQSIALKTILKAINSNVDPEAHLPLQDPANVDRFIRNAIGGVPNRNAGVLRDLQNNPSTANDAMPIVARLANSKYKDVLNSVLGIVDLGDEEEQLKTHEFIRQSIKSANDHKKNALDAILEAFSLGYLERYFYKYKLQNQLRILQDGKVNPQQDKIHRSLVRTYEPIQYNEKNIDLFKLAVVFNFGVKVHLQDYKKSMRKFNEIIADPNIQIAAKAIANIEDDAQLELLAEVLPLIQETYNGDAGIFPALTGLSKYMPHGIAESPETKFTSDIIFETDAQSSGHTINVLQFPQFRNEDGIDILEETLKKVGISFGKTEEETSFDPSQPGPYEDLAALISKYASLFYAEQHMETDKRYFVPKNYEDKNIAINTRYPDMGNEELLRDVVKYPFIMSIYGGGDVTIPQHVSKLIVKSFYRSLDKLQKEYVDSSEEITTFEVELEKPKETYTDYYKILGVERNANRETIVEAFKIIRQERKDLGEDVAAYETAAVNTLSNKDKRKSYDKTIARIDDPKSKTEIVKVIGKRQFIEEEVVPFVNDLTTLEAFKKLKGQQIIEAKELLRGIAGIKNGFGLSQDMYLNNSHLIRDIGNTLAPRFHNSLRDLVGGTKTARDAVIASGEILQAYFEIAFKEEKEKALIVRDKKGDPVLDENDEVVKRNSLTENETIILIREKLTKIFPQIPNPLATESDSYIDSVISLLRAVPGKEKNPLETSQFKFKNYRNRASVAETSNRTVGYELPGVAALIRPVINIDASVLVETLKTFSNLQPLHDSKMGSPDILRNSTVRYGNALIKINRENNILTNILKQVDTVVKNADPELTKKANEWILENGYQNKILKREGMDPLSIKEIRELNDKAQEENQAALKKFHDRVDKEGISATNHMYMARKLPGDIIEEDQSLYSELTEDLNDKIKQLSFEFPPSSESQYIIEETEDFNVPFAPVTTTPEFKEWFKGSVILDKNNEPLTVYHGTAGEFETFDLRIKSQVMHDEKFGAIFFTDEPDFAAFMGTMAAGGKEKGGHVRPVFLNMSNPLRLTVRDGKFTHKSFLDKLLRRENKFVTQKEELELIKKAKADGYDGIIIDHERTMKEFLSEEEVKELGLTNKKPVKGQTYYLVFDPKQIQPKFQNIVKKEETAKFREFSSLPNLPRDNPAPVEDLTGDLETATIKTMFEKIKKYSGDYYKSPEDMKAHTDVLDEVFDLLVKGMDATTRITLDTEQIDGITHGGFTEEVNNLRLSISRKPPLAVNSQSPQEVYVHEIAHTMLSIALKDSPLIAKRVARLYKQIDKQLVIDYKGHPENVFLEGVDNPSERDIAGAVRQYDFIFRHPENEANKLHEFLAYSVTNKQLIDYLKKKSLNLPEREGIWGQVRHAFDILIDVFVKLLNKRFYSKYGSKYLLPNNINAYHEMLAVVEHLVAVQSKHQSILLKLQSKTYKFLSEADKKVIKFGNDLYHDMSVVDADDDTFEGKRRKVTGLIAEGPRMALSDSAITLEKRNVVYKMLNKTLRSTADEIGGGILTESLIEQLLHAKVNISKARQEHERYITNWFNKIWKSVDATKDGAMSIELREAITDVVLRTDLTSLLNINISGNDIVTLLGNKKFRGKERSAIENTFKKARGNKGKALQYARELGFWLAKGDRALPVPHTNAYTIAHKYLISPSKSDIAQLDAYATLASLEHVDTRQLSMVKSLGEREFAKNASFNGFTDLLQGHRVYKSQSLKGLFYNNPTQMIKGYIVERVDNLTHIKTGTRADKKQMDKEGYTESYAMGRVPGIPAAHNMVYVTRIIPEVTDASGIMSTTNQRAMGTTLTEIYSKNRKFWHKTGENKDKPDFRKIKATIKLVKQSEDKKSKVKNLVEDDTLKLTPILDENQNITDFRVMMNHETTRELLRPDLEAQNVFAHMNSGLVDRVNTIESNKKTIDILIREKEDLYKSHPDLFTDLLDPSSKYVERYRKLPRPIREYIKRYAVGNQFMVREDIIDKVFGYKVHDITELEFLQKPENARAKLITGILHNMIRAIVTYGKNRIVIAMPQVIQNNLMSNIYQLSMRNIPMSYILYKIVEGQQEYVRYRNDKEEMMELQHKIAIRNLDKKTSPEAQQVIRLQARIEGNKIHKMSEAGVNSLIVEDINDAQIDGFFNQARRRLRVNHRHSKWSDKYVGNIPKKIGPWKTSDVGAVLFMTKGSKPYQLAHHIVQLTDFLGRYVLIEHLVNVEKKDWNTALHTAINAFVLFDEALTPILEMLDSIGVTSFLSYYLRNNRASRQLVQSNPVGVGLSAAFQYTTGVQSLGNVNASWLGGDFSPNLLQFDELFDEANNMTGVDIVVDVVKSIFD